VPRRPKPEPGRGEAMPEEKGDEKVVAEIQGTRSMGVVTRRKGHDVHMDIHVDVAEMVREIEREKEGGRTGPEVTTEDQNSQCRR